MNIRRFFLLPFASLIVLAACSGGGATPSPAPIAPSDLEGRTFLSTDITGSTLVPYSQVRLTFQDGSVGIQAGCNSMGGAYAIEDGVLQLDAMFSTEMACKEPLMAQDQWLSAFLDGASIALAGDTLTLSKEGTTLTLQDREVADPDRPIEGTKWILDGIVANEAVSSVPAGVTSTLVFEADRVNAETGCNTGSGAATIGDTSIEFGPIGLTKMACEPDAMAVEQAVTSVLQGTVAYAIEADVLTLDAGGTGLTYRAAP
jgi:heat shock protein HslJ